MQLLSWIFKSFCDTTTTADAAATYKIAIFKYCYHRWSEKHLGNTHRLGNASDHVVFPLAFLENDLKIHVLLAVLAVAVVSINDLKIQLCS